MNIITDFLLKRRSTTAKKMLDGNVLDDHLRIIIECGMRVPDHAALNPWKVIVIKDRIRNELGKSVLGPEFVAMNKDATPEEILREENRFLRANVVLGVIYSPLENIKIPKWEMQLSVGAVCQNILIAAQSYNYAAQWLTEWYSYNKKMLVKLGGNPAKDKIAGFIYIGTKGNEPTERKRPIFNDVVKYL